MDIWTVKDGQIVKHWDSLQPLDGFIRLNTLLPEGRIKNDNGLF